MSYFPTCPCHYWMISCSSVEPLCWLQPKWWPHEGLHLPRQRCLCSWVLASPSCWDGVALEILRRSLPRKTEETRGWSRRIYFCLDTWPRPGKRWWGNLPPGGQVKAGIGKPCTREWSWLEESQVHHSWLDLPVPQGREHYFLAASKHPSPFAALSQDRMWDGAVPLRKVTRSFLLIHVIFIALRWVLPFCYKFHHIFLPTPFLLLLLVSSGLKCSTKTSWMQWQVFPNSDFLNWA